MKLTLIKLITSLVLTLWIFNSVYADESKNKEHDETKDSSSISAEFPYKSKFIKVDNVKMHYIDEGNSKGIPIVFIHGMPTNSYLWRNVIPHVMKSGRVIALDLAGFGRSETPPELPQTFASQVHYLDGFIDALDLDEVILVVHDWGGFPGMDWAARHPERIKGLVFLEVLVDLIESACFFPNCQPHPIPPWVSIDDAQQLIVDSNIFLAGIIPKASVQPLSSEIIDNYVRYFETPERRQIYLDLLLDLPVIGEDRPDSLSRTTRYAKWLQESSIPKLLFYATPGFAIRSDNGMLQKALNAPNLTAIDLGVGIHFFQESQPVKIGKGIKHWIKQHKLNQTE